MSRHKELATASLMLSGVVVRTEIRKGAGKEPADLFWLGHLDSIAELLMPSSTTRLAYRVAYNRTGVTL